MQSTRTNSEEKIFATLALIFYSVAFLAILILVQSVIELINSVPGKVVTQFWSFA